MRSPLGATPAAVRGVNYQVNLFLLKHVHFYLDSLFLSLVFFLLGYNVRLRSIFYSIWQSNGEIKVLFVLFHSWKKKVEKILIPMLFIQMKTLFDNTKRFVFIGSKTLLFCFRGSNLNIHLKKTVRYVRNVA